ncbi:Potassium channel [Paecilomyces lecythidis]|uniref:Potassium channel n=1 Tax=Paecilomyces lecythidis TaxID=3004212 RepID=A0ABR3XDF2_9EURO
MLGYFLGHYPQCFALTDDQRTLILQTMAFFIWLLIGGAVFQRVMGIPFADALYFSDVTILTLGFGDITAPNVVSRGLIFPYAVFGIIILGLVVGSIREFAGEMSYDNVVKAHFQRRRKAAVERSVTIEREDSDDDMENGVPRSLSRRESVRSDRMKSGTGYRKKLRRKPIRSAISAIGRAALNRPKVLIMKEEKDRFDAMRAIQSETMRFHRWFTLSMSILAFAIVWTGGAAVFWSLEPLDYFSALYFGFCSLLTIGYGDITPKSNPGRPFFIVWSLIAVPTMTVLISEMSDTIVAGFKRATNSFAEWTILPQADKYRKFFGKFPVLKRFLLSSEERRRVSRGFQVGLDVELDSEGNPIADRPRPTIEKLAQSPPPSNRALARELAFAIRRTADDFRSGEAKQYSYEEWVEFTRLICFTDTSPPGVEGLEKDEDIYGIVDWDWIGETSPMLAEQTEPEWVLDRLCESLIRYLDMDAAAEEEKEEESVLKKEKDIGLEDNVEESQAETRTQDRRADGPPQQPSDPSVQEPQDDGFLHPPVAKDWVSTDRSMSPVTIATDSIRRPTSPRRSRSPSSRFKPTPRRGPFRILSDRGRSVQGDSTDRRRISSEDPGDNG